MPFELDKYLARIGYISTEAETPPTPAANLETLSAVMAAHMRTISFENMDVVLRGEISLSPDDVFDKLVTKGRGGYCFEQNTLLRSALTSLGYVVRPLLCRVRWGKAPTQDTAFTHMCLSVVVNGGTYLADVGFAGTNSMAPVDLNSESEQTLPEGVFHVVKRDDSYSYLEVRDRDDPSKWRALYCWHDIPALTPDLVQSNWYR